jgi:hypothetical protein
MERWRPAVPVVVAALWIAGLRIEGLELALLYLAPAVALLSMLLAGRYPGARTLERWIARTRPRRRAIPTPAPRRPTVKRALPRGGALLAAAFAGRPPPRA